MVFNSNCIKTIQIFERLSPTLITIFEIVKGYTIIISYRFR